MKASFHTDSHTAACILSVALYAYEKQRSAELDRLMRHGSAEEKARAFELIRAEMPMIRQLHAEAEREVDRLQRQFGEPTSY